MKKRLLYSFFALFMLISLPLHSALAVEENAAAQLNIQDADIGAIQDQEYTGEAIEPDLLLMMGDDVLVKDVDYTLRFSKNVDIGANADDFAVITITGIGRYTGTATAYFFIVKATPSVTGVQVEGAVSAATAPADVTLTGTTSVPGVLALMGSPVFLPGETASCQWCFTPADTEHYELVTGTVDIPVQPREVTGITVSGAPLRQTYSHGDRFDPAGVTVTALYDDGLTEPVTGQAVFNGDAPLTAGQTSVPVTFAGRETAISGIEVNRKEISFTPVWSASSFPFDGSSKTVTISNLPPEVTVTYHSNTAAVAGSYTATAIFSLAEGFSPDSYVLTVTGAGTDGQAAHVWTITAPPSSPAAPSGGSSEDRPSSPSAPVLTSAEGQTTIKPSAAARNGSASTTLTAADGKALVEQAVKTNSTTVVIAPEIRGAVNAAGVTIPASIVANLSSRTQASVVVDTPVARIALPNRALDGLTGNSLTVSAQREGDALSVTVHSGRQTISSVRGGLTVTAPVSHASAGTVAVLVDSDGSRTVVRKSAVVGETISIPLEGSAQVEIVDNSIPFQDVAPTSWAYDAAAFAGGHELFSGTGGNAFSPDADMTRGMLAAVLYNLEGSPSVSSASGFSDVDGSAWYSAAASWAAEQGIAAGYPDGSFDANGNVTREQLALMLYRCAGAPGVVSPQSARFADAGSISGYARTALDWAVEQGILSGVGYNTLEPQGRATRAQAAQMLKRYVETQLAS